MDARLMLEEALEVGGRDELLGLRLLFEWAERRKGNPTAAATSGGGGERGSEGAAAEDTAAMPPPAKTRSRGKEVQIAEPGSSETVATEPVPDEGPEPPPGGPAGDNGWWMKESVIEMLKGKVWLASQGR